MGATQPLHGGAGVVGSSRALVAAAPRSGTLPTKRVGVDDVAVRPTDTGPATIDAKPPRQSSSSVATQTVSDMMRPRRVAFSVVGLVGIAILVAVIVVAMPESTSPAIRNIPPMTAKVVETGQHTTPQIRSATSRVHDAHQVATRATKAGSADDERNKTRGSSRAQAPPNKHRHDAQRTARPNAQQPVGGQTGTAPFHRFDAPALPKEVVCQTNKVR